MTHIAGSSNKNKTLIMPTVTSIPTSRFTEFDISLFKSGKHFKLYEKLGSHLMEVEGSKGVYFAVWAPNAKSVAVIGDFNHWNNKEHPLFPRWDGSGIWEGFIPGLKKGTVYKYQVSSADGRHLEKGDPFAFTWEVPPNTASIVWDLDYKWKDNKWMEARKASAGQAQPYSVYEVHIGSWKKIGEEDNRSLTYKEMIKQMVPYVKDLGFTHVEFMPVMEHPFFGSWGYQGTGYFAPSSRHGTPQDFMALIDAFHKAGISVLLDWVPSHFPEDAHGLADYDGTHLYDHADPRKGFHPDWKSCIFNYGRNEVRAFLISNALFWLDRFHADGLRVDAVASMLYLDYSREEGEWIPNEFGGRENLEAVAFLKEFNETVYSVFPDAITIAEESTSWPGVSKPTFEGGLGFGQKWMMGWMHDTLDYFQKDPVYRQYHQNDITFSLVYAFTENFMLPLSHDEVVHGKGALVDRMPGDEWQRFANLRLLFGTMFMHPGTKLLFMGGEFGQTSEWNHDKGLEWWLLEFRYHKGIQNWIRDLNHFYKSHPALYQKQFSPDGFQWIDYSDSANSVMIFLRKGEATEKPLLVVCNFSPVSREHYKIGVPSPGYWKEVLNSDNSTYGGSNTIISEPIASAEINWHGQKDALFLKLAPLALMVFEPTEYDPHKTETKVIDMVS
ncbi:MAG: 1,4-alpha-glucan branching enzyme [Saprospiraceae bacterium]|jgi:1,4-alpha-glucan branching enzyme